MKNGEAKHLVLFGAFPEQKYFLRDYRDSFDLIGFNANIISHAPEGIASFISQLGNKNYFIDPQMYAFQQPLRSIMNKTEKTGDYVIKSSIKNLANIYGSLVGSNVGENQISAEMISGDVVDELTNNIIEFENNYLSLISEGLEINEFLDKQDFEPVILIAPYLYIEPDDFANEISKNQDFINKSFSKKNRLNKNKDLFAEIVIHQDILMDKEYLDDLINAYIESSSDGFILWIDSFSEQTANKHDLEKYIYLLDGLNKSGKPIIMKHGSYFSILLSGNKYQKLAGVGHGIEYGEDRSVVPVGGGVPLAKYYFPCFYKRVDYTPDAINILLRMNWMKSKKVFLDNVCNCATCSKLLNENSDVVTAFAKFGEIKISEKNGRPYPTAAAMDLSRRHYLNTKIKEYNFAKNATQDEIISKLQKNVLLSNYTKQIQPFDHLKKWLSVLS